MAYTQTQLSAIQEAYARGVLEAWLPDGSRIKYRSLDEMERVIDKMKADIATPTHTNVAHPRYKSGFQ